MQKPNLKYESGIVTGFVKPSILTVEAVLKTVGYKRLEGSTPSLGAPHYAGSAESLTFRISPS